MSGGPTSLVPIRESVEEIPVRRCPRVDLDVVALERPELRFPATCKTWRCEFCGPRKARQKAAVMAWAKPERFVTLTNAPENWQQLRQKVRDLVRSLRADGYKFEMGWTVEAGSKSGMVHVHGLQHGSYVPQAHLQQRWGAIADIRAVRGRKGAARYAMKEALAVSGYTMKEAGGNFDEHLERNGGRGCHMTRGYLRGETADSVLEQLQRQRMDGELLTWALVRRDVEAPGGPLRAAAIPPEMAEC